MLLSLTKHPTGGLACHGKGAQATFHCILSTRHWILPRLPNHSLLHTAFAQDLWSPESSSPPVLSHSFSSRSFVGTPTTPALSAESCGSSYCDEFDESFLSGTVVLTIHEANHLPSAGFLKTNKYNPYVRIVVNGTKARRTSAVKNNQNPIWEETFDVELVRALRVMSRDEFGGGGGRPRGMSKAAAAAVTAGWAARSPGVPLGAHRSC